jgi:hypothetical protein
LLKAKYFPRGELIDMVFPSEASPTWRSIEHGLALLKKGIIWRVKSGEKNLNLEGSLDPNTTIF